MGMEKGEVTENDELLKKGGGGGGYGTPSLELGVEC